MNVLVYDYAGYGISRGEASERSCYEDIEAAFEYLRRERKFQPSEIILYGRSLGSGPTCFLAEKYSKAGAPFAGVILQCPILSVYRVALDFRFSLPGDIFCNIDRIATIDSPLTIIHGTRDEVVPFRHGEVGIDTTMRMTHNRHINHVGIVHECQEKMADKASLDQWCRS